MFILIVAHAAVEQAQGDRAIAVDQAVGVGRAERIVGRAMAELRAGADVLAAGCGGAATSGEGPFSMADAGTVPTGWMRSATCLSLMAGSLDLPVLITIWMIMYMIASGTTKANTMSSSPTPLAA